MGEANGEVDCGCNEVNSGNPLPDSFFDELREAYEDEGLGDYVDVEFPKLRESLPPAARKLEDNYEIEGPLGVGGAGITIRTLYKGLETPRVLKIPRPTPGEQKLLTRILEKEGENLKVLSHENIIQIFSMGKIETPDWDIPYYIMEFVEDKREADEFVIEESATREDLLNLLQGIFEAVQHLHKRDRVHLDIKPENILIPPEEIPLLSDLGFAKKLKKGESGVTRIGGTEGFIHPDAVGLVGGEDQQEERQEGKASREKILEDGPTWDLYSLGQTVLSLLEVFNERHPKELSAYEKRYLKLMGCRLLDGHQNYQKSAYSRDERAIGLANNTFDEISYEHIDQVVLDLEKLRGTYNPAVEVPELDLFSDDTIQVTTLSTTPLTPRVKKILNHPYIQRLGRVSQLGLINYLYPTANHTRLEHTLGTYSVLCRYLLALYNDETNPLFRQIMRAEDLDAVILAALLHDVGQFPLGHDIEEADDTISHEKQAAEILGASEGLEQSVASEWGCEYDRVTDILQAKPEDMDGTFRDRILSSLIDGPIDADKIDYLIRDTQRLGLNAAHAIDFDRLLKCLTVVFERQARSTYATLGIHEKGKTPAESVGFARYCVFGQAYWHHTHRAIKSMIHRIVWGALDKCDNHNERYQLREEFREFVRPATSDARQRTLDSVLLHQKTVGDTDETPPAEHVSQINQGDLAVLEWWAERAGGDERKLLTHLKNRRLFKRLYVATKERANSQNLLEDLGKFFSTANPSELKDFQMTFQRNVRAYIEADDTEPKHTTSVTNPSNKMAFNADARKEIAILIDIPPEERARQPPLKFLQEEDTRRMRYQRFRVGRLGNSQVWRALQGAFDSSLGKVRVFCHPDHAEFASSYLSRDDIENLLHEALQEVRDSGRSRS